MDWKWSEKHVTIVALFIWAILSICECHSSNSSLQSHQLISREKFSCPVGCICKSAENVNCRGIGIRNVSSLIHLTTIIKLDLSHNDINHLGPLILKDLPLLEDLDLSANKLTSIDRDALHHPRLKTLSLQSTQLNHIPIGLFSRLPNLQTLHLDLNEIPDLDPLSLASLTSLRHLRLDNNQLNSIPKQALSHLHKLETLNLSFNKIREIPFKALENQTSLVVL